MAAQILNISTQCKKRKDESAFSYKLKACDKWTDATGQYYRDKNSIDYEENSMSGMWCNVFYGANWISYQSFIW